MKNKNKFFILILIFFIVLGLSLFLGSVNLFNYSFKSNTVQTILVQIRLPRVLIACLVGSCLSVCGITLQSILKNPLASPYTLGVSSGASLGAAIAISTGISFLGQFTVPTMGFVFALLTSFVVLLFVRYLDSSFSNETIILTGMILSLFLSAIVSLVLILDFVNSREILLFLSGSIANKSWENFFVILIIFIPCFTYIYLRSKSLDLLTFGEEDAYSLGVNVSLVKFEIIILTSILTGTAVAFCGVIGFIGLVVPHITRRIFGSNHYVSIIMAVFLGAIFLMFTDLIARLVASPLELPVGAITALIGAPFFAIIFIIERRKQC